MKMKHTAGPWKILRELEDGSIIDILLDDTSIQLCDGFDGPEVNRASAHLIAAAPDLMAIVQYLKQHLDEGAQTVHFGSLPSNDPDDETTLGDLINSAIAKARGES